MAQITRDEGPIATKAKRRMENRRVQEHLLAARVQGPVPERLTKVAVPPTGPEGFLILGEEQAVVRVEDAL